MRSFYLSHKAIIGFAILLIGLCLVVYKLETQSTETNRNAVNISHLVHENKESAERQLTNRVANVYTWCGAINEVRNESRYQSTHSHLKGVPPYRLKNLNCPKLANETAHSGKKSKKK